MNQGINQQKTKKKFATFINAVFLFLINAFVKSYFFSIIFACGINVDIFIFRCEYLSSCVEMSLHVNMDMWIFIYTCGWIFIFTCGYSFIHVDGYSSLHVDIHFYMWMDIYLYMWLLTLAYELFIDTREYLSFIFDSHREYM